MPLLGFLERAERAMDRKLRIGVIGLGIMGEQYVRIYQRYPLSEVVAVSSRTPSKALAIAASTTSRMHARRGRSCLRWMK